MKRPLLTTFLVIFCLIQSFGQISFGLKAGLNLGDIKNIGLTDHSTRLGLNGGLFTEIEISEKFITRPELLYSIKGDKFPSTEFNGGGTLSLNYFSIPLLGGFRPSDKFTILLGPEFGFLMSANSKFDGSNHDISKNFRKFDLAMNLGSSFNLKNGLGFELRYSHGFEKLVDVSITDQSGNEIGNDKVGSNRVFQIGVFYKLIKSRKP